MTESFAVRALFGSLVAAALAAIVVRTGLVRHRRARRLLVLAPILAAATAGVASVLEAETYLPQLWLPAPQAERVAAFFNGLAFSASGETIVLAAVYALVVGLLWSRRLAGAIAVRRLLRRGTDGAKDGAKDGAQIVALVTRLSAAMHLRPPRVVLLDRCPGGAFTVGTLRPVVAFDPALTRQLDEKELEGLVAHELAHVARRDPLLCSLVGAFRDLTFFLPSHSLAQRWLYREREESADELASTHTQRPAALASGILKVWDSNRPRHRVAVSCAAVPALLPSMPGRVLGRFAFAGGNRRRHGAQLITARVERLIDLPPLGSLARRMAESALAAFILVLAGSTAVLVPSWIATDFNADSLLFGYLRVPEVQAMSPALATFRALAPITPDVEATARPSVAVSSFQTATDNSLCPCVETQSQLRQGVAATGPRPSRVLQWGAGQAYSLDGASDGTRRARPLFTLIDSGPEVGFFLVGQSR